MMVNGECPKDHFASLNCFLFLWCRQPQVLFEIQGASSSAMDAACKAGCVICGGAGA